MSNATPTTTTTTTIGSIYRFIFLKNSLLLLVNTVYIVKILI